MRKKKNGIVGQATNNGAGVDDAPVEYIRHEGKDCKVIRWHDDCVEVKVPGKKGVVKVYMRRPSDTRIKVDRRTGEGWDLLNRDVGLDEGM